MTLTDILFRYVTASAITGLAILLLCMAGPWLNKIYAAKTRCIIWLMLALYLVLPLELPLWQRPIEAAVSNGIAIYRHRTGGESEMLWSISLQSENETLEPFEPLELPEVSALQKRSVPDNAGTPQNLTLPEILTLIWGFGCVLVVVYEWLKYRIYQKRLKRWCKPARNALTVATAEEISKEIGITKTIPVFLCDKTGSPMMTGLLHPCIFLPHEDFAKQELSMILRHELTHYKRRDLWRKVLLLSARVVHWFNPLVYLMCRHAEADMEQACDDCLLKGESQECRKAYSEMIFTTIKCQKEYTLSTYFYGGTSVMKERFQNILQGENKKRGSWICFIVCLCVIGANSLVGCGKVSSSPDYNASSQEGVSMSDDYDAVTAICVDACKEFVRAVRTGEADFSPYISNAALNAYMEYRVQNSIFAYTSQTETNYLITEVAFADDYAMVKGILETSSDEAKAIDGEIDFLLTNEQGRLVISDWYWNYMDLLDFIYRGEFSPEKNLGYWNDPANYTDFMNALQLAGQTKKPVSVYFHSEAEVEQAKDVVLRYVSCLDQGDWDGMKECTAAGEEISDYTKKWTRYVVHDLRYEPGNHAYYMQKKALKEIMPMGIKIQNWLLLTMDCDMATRYQTYTMPTYWLLVREDENGPWKIFYSYK